MARAHLLKYHMRVNKATNGFKNRIFFTTALTPTVQPTYNVAYFEFTGYNTFLSIQDNGTNDSLSIINSAGAAASYP